MTEAEWLACNDPRRMLEHPDVADDRKLRLFSCAYARTAGCLARFHVICRRRFYDQRGRPRPPLELGAAQAELLAVRRAPDGSRYRFRFDGLPPLNDDGDLAISIAESVADGKTRFRNLELRRPLDRRAEDLRTTAAAGDLAAKLSLEEHEAVLAAGESSARAGALWTIASAKHEFIAVSTSPSMKQVNRSLRRRVVEQTHQLQADLLREIFGNPFQPVAFDRERLDPALREIARSIYDRRAYEELPILADALGDAGFVPDEIVEHLGGDRPHVRGCWALDAVLGPPEPEPLFTPRLVHDPYYGWLGVNPLPESSAYPWPFRR